MTREEAIRTLRELWRETNDPWYEEVYNMAIEALKYLEAMTEREALSDIVKVIGTLTCGKERWFENNGCWYDRKECDYIQNETLVERIGEALREEIDL